MATFRHVRSSEGTETAVLYPQSIPTHSHHLTNRCPDHFQPEHGCQRPTSRGKPRQESTPRTTSGLSPRPGTKPGCGPDSGPNFPDSHPDPSTLGLIGCNTDCDSDFNPLRIGPDSESRSRSKSRVENISAGLRTKTGEINSVISYDVDYSNLAFPISSTYNLFNAVYKTTNHLYMYRPTV